MKPTPDSKTPTALPQLVVIANAHPEPAATPPNGARQRLEDEFRRRFIEQHPRSELAMASRLEGLHLDTEPAATINGRTS